MRRTAGMGSVYRRKSDGRWVAALSTGPRTGRTTMVRYAPRDDNTKRAALGLLDELRQLARPANATGRTTTGQYLRSWLDTAGRRSLKASTWRTYDVALRRHIDPAIGHLALTRLTAEHVDAMLARSTLEPKGQRNVLGFLGRVLDVAVDRGHVIRNAARHVDPPRASVTEPRILTVEEWRRVRDAIRGDRLEALWVVAIGTGLRQGELLGLRWEDVDLARGTLAVPYSLVRVAGEYRLDEPKTKGSRRAMTISPFVVDALRDHRARQLEERIAAGRPTAEGLVFVTEPGRASAADPDGVGGRPLNGGWVSHRWRKIADGLDLPVTMHALRHTNATILRDMGVDEHIRMPRMGHTTTGTHRRYAHARDAADRVAADAIQEALG